MEWQDALRRWVDAGLIDGSTATSIRAFEAAHPAERASWPIRLALTFGALAIGAGVLLFVSAHWDGLSPGARFLLVLLLTAMFHVGGAFTTPRLPALGSTLHAIGTVACGAGIFLTGQIFNLSEHWPSGFMLSALGAFGAWFLLRDLPQFVLFAVLAPTWLITEWIAAIDQLHPQPTEALRILAVGLFLLAMAYLCAPEPHSNSHDSDRYRTALNRLGAIVVIPTAFALGLAVNETLGLSSMSPALPIRMRLAGWSTAIAIPVAVALLTRRRDAMWFGGVVIWTLLLLPLRHSGDLLQYGWWGVGSVLLVAWGVRESRVERINLGAALFAATILAFYFSQVMDKFSRSLSLLIVGALFLGGGAALERIRRRLVARAKEGPA